MTTEVLPHAFDCPASGGPAPLESCLTCLHEREMSMLTVDDVLEAICELEQRWGRGVEHGFSADVTLELALAYLTHFRSTMHVGPVRRNRAKCLSCGDTVESLSHHHFVRCSCGNIAVDGGSHICNRAGGDAGFEQMVTSWPGVYLQELRIVLGYAEEWSTEPLLSPYWVGDSHIV